MKPVKVYTTTYCPYCVMAKNLLKQEGILFEEIVLKTDKEKMDLVERTKHRTVPQIFFGETFIGGFDDLEALSKKTKLSTLLEE